MLNKYFYVNYYIIFQFFLICAPIWFVKFKTKS